MGWLERILGGHHGGRGSHEGGRDAHGGGHGYGGGHGSGGHHDQAWGKTAAPPQRATDAVTCPKCMTANAQGARFCSQCATSLGPVVCGKCNVALATGARFCSQCGSPVTG